jgi:hypothetical protein
MRKAALEWLPLSTPLRFAGSLFAILLPLLCMVERLPAKESAKTVVVAVGATWRLGTAIHAPDLS